MKRDNLKSRLQQLPAPKPTAQQFEQAEQMLPRHLSQLVAQASHLKHAGIRFEIKRLFALAMVSTALAGLALVGAHTYLQQQEDDASNLDELSVASMLII